MAKNVGRLAGLAALAGAAYMMSKGKDKDKEGPAATAAEKDASEARTKAQRDAVSGNKSAENKLETPAETIARSDKSAEKYNITDENYSNEGYGKGINQAGASGTTTLGPGYNKSDKPEPPKSSKLEPKNEPPKPKNEPPKPSKLVSEPSDKSIKLAPKKRDLEAGMSRGTRTPAKPVSTVSSSEEGMKNYKPRRTPAAPSTAKSTVSSSEEGMKNYKPRSTQPSVTKSTPLVAAKTVAKTATQGPATSATSAASPAKRETYRDLSGKIKYKEPSGSSASQIASDAVASGAKKIGSGIADYVRNFETPAERRAREAKNPPPKSTPREYNEDALSTGSAMRRGGMVKKMASGGMTASRRGDGIASRGKTRCKMY